MKTNYFVNVCGLDVLNNCTKQSAINRAIKEHEKNLKLGAIQIGIGRTKIIKGKKLYTMVPYFYYL